MNKCGTCKHRNEHGECLSDKLEEHYGQQKEDDALVYSYAEGGGFWVGPNFGCVHWAGKEATI